MMSNLIILVMQEKKSRSSNGRNKQITIVPKIKFQGKNCSLLRHTSIKKLHNILPPKYLGVVCKNPLKNATDPKNSKTRKVLP